jgi:predicted dehydrogenase
VVQIGIKNKHKVKKILIVGLGSIGTRHLQVIKELFPDIKIFALRHKSIKDSEVAEGIELSFVNVKEAIKQKPDMAIIANPSPMHLVIATDLADAGIHLLIEKPLSNNCEGVSELLSLSSARNIKLMTGFNLRFLPCLVFLKKQIDESKAGNVLSIQAEVGQNLSQWRPASDYSTGVSARKDLGGGVLLELCHEIDYLAWIFGRVQWVIGSLSNQSNLNIDVEDTANIFMGLKAKAFNNNNIDVVLKMDFTRLDISRNVTVIGDEGTLKCNLINGEVSYYCGTKGCWEEIFLDNKERNYTFQLQLKSFINSIESDCEPEITGADGLLALEIIQAIRSSNVQDKKIYLD